MKLIEALDIVASQSDAASPAAPVDYFLACGFEPLHLRSFLNAHLQLRLPSGRVAIQTGLFGDLAGNIRRAANANVSGCAVVMEWTDIDPRLGLREPAPWGPDVLPDIVATADSTLGLLEGELGLLAESCPTVLALPAIPLLPLTMTPALQTSEFQLELTQKVLAFGSKIAARGRVRIADNPDRIAPSARYDIRSDLLNGFPYTLAYADVVASVLAALLQPSPRRKGIITDLDDTLWKGIVGDVGIEGISWDLAGHARLHGIYQQVLEALAARGVLVAVASKNDPALVAHALARPDLRISPTRIYPISVHWRPKSESVTDILQVWNIGADAVVFIDDNPMELAEVKASHPAIECAQFPKDAGNLPDFLENLRDWFGKSDVSDEDLLRSQSIRAGSVWREAGTGPNEAFEAFLSRAEARITVVAARSAELGRPFELVNKTNQFNLNGRRYTESEWIRYLAQPGAFLATVAYEDKFGPLGVISVALGRPEGKAICIDAWVLSCRAFARRVEHQFVNILFELFPVDEIVLDYLPTGRNGPTQEFLSSFGTPEPAFRLTKGVFAGACPVLYHSTEGTLQ